MPEHRRRFVARLKVAQQALVQLREHFLHHVSRSEHHALAFVDDLVILALCAFEVGEHVFAHGDAVGSVAVVHDVYGQVVDDAGVRGR